MTASAERLPGDLMIWVLIVSELLVFGAGLLSFLAVRISDPSGFTEAQDLLDRTAGAVNTMILLTSGLFAALANQARRAGRRPAARLHLSVAASLGLAFLIVKTFEYADKADLGIDIETHAFFMFYYLLTGFHAAHVMAGILVLGLVAWKDKPENVENGTAFWHMVDLVWLLIYPVIYLLR